jgi:hypothetical protein
MRKAWKWGGNNLEKFKFAFYCFISKYAKATRLKHKILLSFLLVQESLFRCSESLLSLAGGSPYVPICGTGCMADIQAPLSVVKDK